MDEGSSKWRVVFACAVINFLHLAQMKIMGLQFVATRERFNVDRNQAAFPYVLRYIVAYLSGPFVGYLGCTIGLQPVILFGCFLASLSIGMCFFAEDIFVLTLCWGILNGLGSAMTGHLLPSYMSLHFTTKLARANGLAFFGASLGGFLYPPFYEYLLETFGISGAFLILAAYTLNTVPAALILAIPHSPDRLPVGKTYEEVPCNLNEKVTFSVLSDESGSIKRETILFCDRHQGVRDLDFQEYKVKEKKLSTGNSKGLLRQMAFEEVPCNSDGNMKILSEVEAKECNLRDDAALLNDLHQTDRECDITVTKAKIKHPEQLLSENTSSPSLEVKVRPVLNLGVRFSDEEIQARRCDNHLPGNPKYVGMRRLTPAVLKVQATRKPPLTSKKQSTSLQIALKLFHNPLFILIAFTQSSFLFAITLHSTIVVDFALDQGATVSQSVYLLMCSAIADCVALLSLGFVTDRGWISTTNFSAICYFFFGIGITLFALSNEFVGMLLSIALSSFFSGGQLLTFPVIVSQYFQEEKRTIAMASRYVLIVPMSFAVSPLIGFFRESHGSYEWLFYSIHMFSIFCGILLLLIPIVAKWGRKNTAEKL